MKAAIEARNRATVIAEDLPIHEKHAELDTRLRHVYVESEGRNAEIQTKRRLPEDRTKVGFVVLLYSLYYVTLI